MKKRQAKKKSNIFRKDSRDFPFGVLLVVAIVILGVIFAVVEIFPVMRPYFAEIIPDFERDRVYTTDIRKLFSWYNQLIAAGITEFKDNEIAEDQAAEAAEAADDAQTTK